MQQTSKYQFKLIEGTDDFSPTPLNDNMEKVEEQLETMEESLTAVTADLGAGNYNCRMAFGTYIGTGTHGESSPNVIQVDFTPMMIMVGSITPSGLYWPTLVIRPMTAGITGAGNTMPFSWGEHSVQWCSDGASSQLNINGNTYVYLVLGH